MDWLSSYKNLQVKFRNYFLIIYVVFTYFLLKTSQGTLKDNSIFYIQLGSIVLFVLFFSLGYKFSPSAFLLFVFIYQLSLSVFWGEWFLQHQYLLDNNADWCSYVKWASISQQTSNFIDFIRVLSEETFEFADMGYPIFLYPYYKIFPRFENAYLAAVIGKAIFYSIGSLYVYKSACFFLDKPIAKIVFLLWALNPASIFFNGVNLKENVFVTICIFVFYALITFRKSKNPLYFFLFCVFTFFTALFRIFVTLFLLITFLAITIFKKLVYNHFKFIWITIGILGIFIIKILSNYLGNLAYFLSQSLGGGSNISMPVLIITAFISPIPALQQNRTTPDNLLVCAYSIFTILFSFYAIYELVLIFKKQKKNLYPLLFLTFFNKLMVIIAARSNEYRFQYPLVFTYIILMISGFYDVETSGIKISRKRRLNERLIFVIFLIFAVGATYIYNK